MKKVEMVIVSRSPTVARMMMSYLKEAGGGETAIAGSERKLFQVLKVYHPRMIFIENCFMGKVTCDLIQRILRRDGEAVVTAFTVQEYPDFEVAKFMYWGAWSYLSLREEGAEIAGAVRKILRGGSYYPEHAAERVERFEEAKPVQERALTKREREVVKLIADNKTVNQIAKLLGITFSTAKSHRENILKKIEGHGTADIIRYSFSHGIVTIDDYAERERGEYAAAGKGEE
jgi:DNA-binding NarL/FixJ family response regulator